MSKKDYELIARALKSAKPLDAGENSNLDTFLMWCAVIHKMAAELEKDNPRFNRAKFLQACGYNN